MANKDFALTGGPGAVNYRGTTASGAPTSGSFALGDYVVDASGAVWICTQAGHPGLWTAAYTTAAAVSSVFGRTGAVVAATGDYTFAQIGAAANAVAVTNLAAGLAGQVLGGTGPGYAYPPGYELGYTAITASVNITGTTDATSTTIITAAAITFDGGEVICEMSAPAVLLPTAAAGNAVIVSLFEGSTQVSRMCKVFTPSVTAQDGVPLLAHYRFAPTAGAHTYIMAAFASSTTGTPQVVAGTGGASTDPPAYIRFLKV